MATKLWGRRVSTLGLIDARAGWDDIHASTLLLMVGLFKRE
jgi:hypothetical protein